jgi:hypothetical protein
LTAAQIASAHPLWNLADIPGIGDVFDPAQESTMFMYARRPPLPACSLFAEKDWRKTFSFRQSAFPPSIVLK